MNLHSLLLDVNGSDIVNQPWYYWFKPFTDLLGGGFYLIPISFIAVALYIKTQETTAVSIWLIASCLLLATGNMFTNHPEMAFAYLVFAALGMIGAVVSIFFMRR